MMRISLTKHIASGLLSHDRFLSPVCDIVAKPVPEIVLD
jgi:hypothetical protein